MPTSSDDPASNDREASARVTWSRLVLHWLATSAATLAAVVVAPAGWEIWAVTALVALGAVMRRVPLLGDQHAPLEQLSGWQSVLIVIPGFPIAIAYALALMSLSAVSSAPATMICATVFCLGLANMVGHLVAVHRG